MTGPARIVAVSTYPLHRRQGGGALRGSHLLAGLCRPGDVRSEVVSVTVDPALAGRYEVAEGVTERVVALSERHRRAEDRLRIVTGPVSITYGATSLLWPATPELAAALERGLDGADAVLHVQPYLSPAVATLAPGLAAVCDEHNHELGLKRRIYPDNDGGRWLLARVGDAERTAAVGAALVTATTGADLSAVVADLSIPEDRAAIVPNGVDTASIPFTTGADRRRCRADLLTALGIDPTARRLALFVGSGHGPNIDAGRAILAQARGLPDVHFLLAGRHSTQLGRSGRRTPNVHLLGEVSDERLELLLAGADVALNLMTTGGGSNLKLLTYLAAGLPVVTTPTGARGIDTASAGVVVEEDPVDLGAAIARALDVGATDRAAVGRTYVEHHCDWAAIGSRFGRLVREKVLR